MLQTHIKSIMIIDTSGHTSQIGKRLDFSTVQFSRKAIASDREMSTTMTSGGCIFPS